MDFWLNRAVRRDAAFAGLFDEAEYRAVSEYYAAQPHLPSTPLRSAPAFARSLGLSHIDLKDETHRFGLNAFKIAGARYAIHRLGNRANRGLVCATAGNHGRAVARVARERGVPSTIFVPAARDADPLERATRDRRLAAMREDGATVVEIDGPYEEAVRRAAAHGESTGAEIVSDVSWAGYEEIPRWIMAGYTRLFEEAERQWQHAPDLVVVQGGVGGLVCAAASWFARRFGATRPAVVACEPDGAACLLESSRAGSPVTLPGELRSVMAGLKCAAPSPAAWPAIAAGVDVFVSVPDALALDAMERLRGETPPIQAGPSGACGAAALIALAGSPALARARSALAIGRDTRALAVVTEGP